MEDVPFKGMQEFSSVFWLFLTGPYATQEYKYLCAEPPTEFPFPSHDYRNCKKKVKLRGILRPNSDSLLCKTLNLNPTPTPYPHPLTLPLRNGTTTLQDPVTVRHQ